MSSDFKVTLTHDSGDAGVNRSFNMSAIEVEVHFSKEVKILQNSPISAVSVKDEHGTVTIEKRKSS
ncbi:MAG: hypothetical protein RM049_07550 [Nostoc sp. DedQUE04]|uniref:hypothetical protein n=1 Tax=Nostoc sp. DedQUE04 TaxID=3075390 RepID=UPI002AD48601|nr:hypothetical protein [Nostoc sp. DedQUE04]MDZ8135145.1 hypothetical protein [Nostoc sp. DedQUE04]